MTPEIVIPLMRIRQREIEVLKLREREKDRRLGNVDPKLLELRVVEIPRVLQRQLLPRVGLLHARVLDDVDLLGRPARRDVRDHGLQQHRPRAREADERRGRRGQVVFLPAVLHGGIVRRDGRRRGRRQRWERIYYRRRDIGRCGFVLGMWWSFLFFLVDDGVDVVCFEFGY